MVRTRSQSAPAATQFVDGLRRESPSMWVVVVCSSRMCYRGKKCNAHMMSTAADVEVASLSDTGDSCRLVSVLAWALLLALRLPDRSDRSPLVRLLRCERALSGLFSPRVVSLEYLLLLLLRLVWLAGEMLPALLAVRLLALLWPPKSSFPARPTTTGVGTRAVSSTAKPFATLESTMSPSASPLGASSGETSPDKWPSPP
eukprot:GHVT01002827.1.p1 GENE.GHVT01002827.1~~GHVT01002827.1.p1  ORF type:complete len:201 (+),score=31.67 GHVT01002827.1:1155-1757(+)